VTLLGVHDVVVRYGQAVAVDGVSLEVGARERVALIGPNGAGKTSVLNAACGVVRPSSGRIRIEGEDVTGATPGAVVRRGISQVPEGRHVFATLPVEANLLLGAYGRVFSLEIVSSTLRYLRSKNEVRQRLERVYTLLPQLRELRDRPAARTSGGQQQMVAIGRALMSNPRLLLCDEISLGLAPIVIRDIYVRIPQIAAEGISLIIVEQDIVQALKTASHVICLQEGRVSLEGEAKSMSREKISAAYFGV
jgi:branched-chain amino acid transport system ATP-binding protein